jgi:Chaperone of endosialidase
MEEVMRLRDTLFAATLAVAMLPACAGIDPGNVRAAVAEETSASSSRSLKKDIAYLSPGEVDQLEEAVLAIRLASFRYKQGDSAKHLGFILEDSPSIPAADVPHARVDLYAYTSMAIAALQAQARRIEELEATVDSLSNSIEASPDSGPSCQARRETGALARR